MKMIMSHVPRRSIRSKTDVLLTGLMFSGATDRIHSLPSFKVAPLMKKFREHWTNLVTTLLTAAV